MSDLTIFNTLKKSVIKTFLKTNNAPADIKNWTGDIIICFQEDLFTTVKARVSEKWFYTYFKNDADKLPRIDMLNLLSEYVGFKNWMDFKTSSSNTKKRKSKSLKIILLAFVFSSVLITIWFTNRNYTYNFCFVDDINGLPIKQTKLDIKVLNESETPIYLKSNENGCFNYKTDKDYIKFVVQSPYYKTDTIIKSITNLNNGYVKLYTDDYALMLDYYSKNKVNDWEIHRNNLEAIFSDDAIIYQVYPNNMGVELYAKNEFINKLTIPTKSLKQMKIISKHYTNGKIVKLKFIIE